LIRTGQICITALNQSTVERATAAPAAVMRCDGAATWRYAGHPSEGIPIRHDHATICFSAKCRVNG